MVPFGGTGLMALGGLAAAAVALLVYLLLSRFVRADSAAGIAGLGWSLVAIALVTLVPTDPDPGIVPAEERSTSCSWTYGGPSGLGFDVLGLDQRTLNIMLFVPAGFFLVLAVARRSGGFVLVLTGFVALAAYSLGIEWVQLELARLDRACDVTDMVDNVAGAGIGVLVALLAWPWWRRAH